MLLRKHRAPRLITVGRRRLLMLLICGPVPGSDWNSNPARARERPPETTRATECGLPPRDGAGASNAEATIVSTDRSDPPYRIVCRFHVVRRADGSGGIDESLIPFFMRDLNYGYRDTPFNFVREPGITYIDNTTLHTDFPTFPSMVPTLNTYYKEGVINIFLTPSVQSGQFPASSWVGPPFTAGERGLLMAYAATGTPSNIATPPHEIGHIFDLLHPIETVRRVNSVTGASMGAFVTAGSGGLSRGQGILFHSDGLMYVSNGNVNNILRYDAHTGAFHDVFVGAASGGLSNPHSLRFGPDGHLYVASRDTHSVKKYNGVSGAFIGDFVAAGEGGSPGTGGLNLPTGILFVPQPKPTIPAATGWGLIFLALLLLSAGTLAAATQDRRAA